MVYIVVMAKHHDKLSDQIRRAVDESGFSRYAICQQIGIPQSLMSRFMAGAWLGQENFDALAELLGLSIRADRPKKKGA